MKININGTTIRAADDATGTRYLLNDNGAAMSRYQAKLILGQNSTYTSRSGNKVTWNSDLKKWIVE